MVQLVRAQLAVYTLARCLSLDGATSDEAYASKNEQQACTPGGCHTLAHYRPAKQRLLHHAASILAKYHSSAQTYERTVTAKLVDEDNIVLISDPDDFKARTNRDTIVALSASISANPSNLTTKGSTSPHTICGALHCPLAAEAAQRSEASASCRWFMAPTS